MKKIKWNESKKKGDKMNGRWMKSMETKENDSSYRPAFVYEGVVLTAPSGTPNGLSWQFLFFSQAFIYFS